MGERESYPSTAPNTFLALLISSAPPIRTRNPLLRDVLGASPTALNGHKRSRWHENQIGERESLGRKTLSTSFVHYSLGHALLWGM